MFGDGIGIEISKYIVLIWCMTKNGDGGCWNNFNDSKGIFITAQNEFRKGAAWVFKLKILVEYVYYNQ